MTLFNDFFENNIPEKIYKTLNKDRGVNYHFRSDNVGKCAQLFDRFRRDRRYKFTMKNWEKYYFTKQAKEPLIEASDYIKQKHKIDIEIAKKYVYFRVIGQTWNGMVTEENIINELHRHFINIMFIKTEYEKDEQYFTDWEAISNKKKLLFGIQIKPISYKNMNSPYQLQAKKNHRQQAEKYIEEFNVPHIVVYYQDKKLYNPKETFDKIDTMLFLQIKQPVE